MEIVRFLVEEVKVDVNQITSSGETALHRACYRNRTEFVKFLLSKGADIEACHPKLNIRHTPFIRACMNNRVASIDQLLQHGAKIDFTKAPFDSQFYDKLQPETKKIIEKHEIMRKKRVVLRMYDVVKKETTRIKNGESAPERTEQ